MLHGQVLSLNHRLRSQLQRRCVLLDSVAEHRPLDVQVQPLRIPLRSSLEERQRQRYAVLADESGLGTHGLRLERLAGRLSTVAAVPVSRNVVHTLVIPAVTLHEAEE